MEVLNDFNTLTLKQIFRKTKSFFKNLEYRFLVESTKIENVSFLCKSSISGTNVRTDRVMGVGWTYRRERSFSIS